MNPNPVIRPMFNWLLVNPAIESEMTESGLHLPPSVRRPVNAGQVLAVGEDVNRIKVGDVVVHGQFSDHPIQVGRNKYILLKEEDVLAILQNEDGSPAVSEVQG